SRAVVAVPGSGLDPLLRLEALQEPETRPQRGDLAVELGQITAGAVALFLQENHVVGTLEGLQSPLLGPQLFLNLVGLGPNRGQRPVGTTFPGLSLEGEILVDSAIEKGACGRGLGAQGL